MMLLYSLFSVYFHTARDVWPPYLHHRCSVATKHSTIFCLRSIRARWSPRQHQSSIRSQLSSRIMKREGSTTEANGSIGNKKMRVENSTTIIDPVLAEKCIRNIRVLAADVVQKANSGHPGAPMGCAPMAHLLWGEFMNFDPQSPNWWDRDRFILSNGHACALLYRYCNTYLIELKIFG